MVNYEFYTCDYRGNSIDVHAWPQFEARAAEQLARYKRIYSVKAPGENSEALAICAMAEALYGFTMIVNGEGGAVSSASIGSVSVSYGSAGSNAVDISPKGQAKELYRCACMYLDICRGVG